MTVEAWYRALSRELDTGWNRWDTALFHWLAESSPIRFRKVPRCPARHARRWARWMNSYPGIRL